LLGKLLLIVNLINLSLMELANPIWQNEAKNLSNIRSRYRPRLFQTRRSLTGCINLSVLPTVFFGNEPNSGSGLGAGVAC
jgi:hypothetical protein